MWRSDKRKWWVAGLPIIALIAAACSSAGAGSIGSGSLSMRISSPDQGARVSSPFTVALDASVPLGEPGTGWHHVHLCFDGADCDVQGEYSVVYGESLEVAGLSPGEHTIEASLRNADHSDAGVTDEITVTVGEGGDTAGGTDPGGSMGRGFAY